MEVFSVRGGVFIVGRMGWDLDCTWLHQLPLLRVWLLKPLHVSSKSHFPLNFSLLVKRRTWKVVEWSFAACAFLLRMLGHALQVFMVRVPYSGVTKFNQSLIYVLVADAIPSMLHDLIQCKTRRCFWFFV